MVKIEMTWSVGGRRFGVVETRQCPACDEALHREILRRPDGLPVVECAACGLRYVNPQPTSAALKAFYESGYFDGAQDFFTGDDYFTHRDKGIDTGKVTGWSDVKALGVQGRSVLDLGCASGALLVLAKRHGAGSVKGIELDDTIAQRGREAYGIDIRVGDVLSLLRHESDRFDIVCAFDLVEHIKEPQALLHGVASVLEPGGRFVCCVPNGHCIDIWKLDWIGATENMEHLSYFRRSDLDRLARTAGLRLESVASRGFPLRLRAYSGDGAGLRPLREPWTALKNIATKMRFRLFGRGEHHELAAVFRKLDRP